MECQNKTLIHKTTFSSKAGDVESQVTFFFPAERPQSDWKILSVECDIVSCPILITGVGWGGGRIMWLKLLNTKTTARPSNTLHS